MGMAYCLQYMHHDLNPPVSHSNLNAVSVLLTDDFAAKVCSAHIYSLLFAFIMYQAPCDISQFFCTLRFQRSVSALIYYHQSTHLRTNQRNPSCRPNPILIPMSITSEHCYLKSFLQNYLTLKNKAT